MPTAGSFDPPATPGRGDLFLFAVVFLFSATIVAAFITIYHVATTLVESKRIADRQENLLELAQHVVRRNLSGTASDIRVLASGPTLARYLDAGDETSKAQVADQFARFMTYRRIYDQIRFLDIVGEEVVRLNFGRNGPVVVTAANLQDKSERYYFREAITLAPGQIYVSPLDLNMERNEIERPFRPMIRFATPVFDATGSKRGILVANVLAQGMLDELGRTLASEEADSMLVNRAGYWLMGPEEAMLWGFLFDDSQRMDRYHPEAWVSISALESGWTEDRTHTFLFKTIRPLEDVSQIQDVHREAYWWKIIVRMPRKPFFPLADTRFWLTAGLFLALLLSTAIASWHWVRVQARHRTSEEALRASEEKERMVLESTGDGIFGIDIHGNFTFCNPAAASLLGHDDSALLLGRNLYGIVQPKWENGRPVPEGRCQISATLATGKETTVDDQLFRRSDGIWVPVEYQVRPMLQGASCIGAVVTFSDVTERRMAERNFRKVSQAVEQSPVSIIITDTEGVIEYVNPKTVEVSGYAANELIGRSPRILKSGETSADEYKELWRTISSGGQWHGEFHNKKKNGDLYWEAALVAPIKEADGTISHYLAIKEDITVRKEYEERLNHQTYYDDLTDLPNRTLVVDRLALALAAARRNQSTVVVGFVDLDNFTVVNDTLGHTTGDVLLVEAAKRMVSIMRESDTVARYSGDVFTLILPDLSDISHAETVARKILAAMARPFLVEEQEVFITVSIGLAVSSRDTEDREDPFILLQQADAALHKAKETGGNTLRFFLPEMNERAKEYLLLGSHLAKALERNEFSIHYQPLVRVDPDMHSMVIVGAEALIRWDNPELGSVPPDRFIPLAEETGLITTIGEFVLDCACRNAASWRDATTTPLYVSVNVSSRQFREGTFVQTVARILKRYDLPGNCLQLEVTERLLVEDIPETLRMLHDLRGMGVRLSVDDFGTGYSSLSYLRRFPFDVLKIDQSFTRDMNGDAGNIALTVAIISMAESLGLKVVAEGVESKDQLESLRALGCKFVQGFYLGYPLPEAEFRNALQ